MDVKFEEHQDGRYSIKSGDERSLGMVVPQQDGSYGYSLFGTPHMGRESSLEDVEKAVKRHLD